MAEGFPVTLVNVEDSSDTVVAHSPTTLTQYRSQGYRDVPADEAPPTGYVALTKAQLEDEIRRRNEARGDDPLPLTGTKAELVAVLEQDDAAAGSAVG